MLTYLQRIKIGCYKIDRSYGTCPLLCGVVALIEPEARYISQDGF
jgi:hypothetical protein